MIDSLVAALVGAAVTIVILGVGIVALVWLIDTIERGK